MTNISQIFMVDEDKDQNEFNLLYFAPKLIWLLKDITEGLVDPLGKEIPAEQYLEVMLSDVKNQRVAANGLRIRQSIINLMKNRECIAFGSYNANSPSNSYVAGVYKLKERIYSRCSAKQVEGVNLTTRMFTLYLSEIIDAVNTNEMFILLDIWDRVLEDECQYAYLEATETNKKYLRDRFSDQEDCYTDNDLEKYVTDIRDATMSKFTRVAYLKEHHETLYPEFLLKLQQYIASKEELVYKINDGISIE